MQSTNLASRPISFHPASVVFETPSHAELLEKVGVRSLITGVIDELLTIAKAQGCQFKPGFREQTMEQMIVPAETNTIMYQDFLARRPMELETYLGSPMKIAQEVGVPVPRIETLYALLHNTNTVNLTRPAQAAPSSPVATERPPPQPRISSMGGPRPAGFGGPGPMGRGPPPMLNGMRPGSRAPSQAGGPPPPGMRRGPPPMNGYPPRAMNGNGFGPRGPPPQMSRRGSFEGNDLEEFSHVMLYDDMQDEGGVNASTGDLALRERELALRHKELALREREYNMRRGGRGMPPGGFDEDDEDGDDFFDPMGGPGMPHADAENIDMMSVTSRRTRKAPSAGQLRSNPEMMAGAPMGRNRNPWKRGPPPKNNRASAALMNDMPSLRQELMNNPLMGYSSDRYGHVDRNNIGAESRTNSLTAERLSELQHGPGGPGPNGFGGGPPGPMSRRGSQSPGNPFIPGQRNSNMNGNGLRPSPPANGNSYGNGRPSPPGMRQPVPRHPPGHGNAVTPQQIEQQSGVSHLYPPKASQAPQVRSLTGSASASAGSGDSNRSAPIDSEPSAHSSASSFQVVGARPPIGVR